MPPGPGPDLLDDPRFEDVFQEALAKQGLHPTFGDPVRRLVEGTADPRSFQCCNSGCEPCVKDYLGAAEHILKVLMKPARPRRRWAFWRR